MANSDYKKTLNTMLSFYYDSKSPFRITTELHRNDIILRKYDIHATINTLIKDEHIKDIAPGYSRIPVCIITGSGRVFYEQGGYQDNSTKFDRIVKWTKNNTFLAWVLISFMVVTALIGLTVSLIAIYKFFAQ